MEKRSTTTATTRRLANWLIKGVKKIDRGRENEMARVAILGTFCGNPSRKSRRRCSSSVAADVILHIFCRTNLAGHVLLDQPKRKRKKMRPAG